MTIAEASKILSRMKFRVGTDDLNTTIRMCEENEAIDVVLKYCFDLASLCNENCPQIVRCKDCKHESYCSIHETKFSDDWFCADGEKRVGESE
jgi:hypothetical protein